MQSLLIQRLAGQIYAMAGMQIRLNLQADRTGTFLGENTQFNGILTLTVATLLLAADRYAGMHFFTDAAGGNIRQDMQIMLFPAPIISLMVAGTLVVVFNLNSRMM